MTTRKVGVIGWKVLGLLVMIASLVGGAILSEGKHVDTGLMLVPVLCGTGFWAGLIMLFSKRPAYVFLAAAIFVVSCLVFFGCSDKVARSAFLLLFGVGVLLLGLIISLYVLFAYAFEEKRKVERGTEQQPEEQPEEPERERRQVLKRPV